MKLILIFVLYLLAVIINGRVDSWNSRYISKRNRQNHLTPPFLNTRPIIGILSQELNSQIYRLCTLASHRSYIAASYVKYIESAGARVVPIRIGQSDSYYEEMVNSVNGILLPGGGAVFNSNGGYSEYGKKIINLAIKYDLPVWGTCLGFELILLVAANGSDIRTKCLVKDITLPLDFEPGFEQSKLFGNAPMDVVTILRAQNVTANMHNFCITRNTWQELKLDNEWQIMSYNKVNGVEFTSTVESKKHPIYGTQFHPEKNSFEWQKNHFPHTLNAIKVSQYFASFFVSEARKNVNRFASTKREHDSLIYNYKPLYASKIGCPLEQCYFID